MRNLLTVGVVVLALAALFGMLQLGDRRSIARAQAEATQVQAQRDSLLAVVAGYDAARDTLMEERAVHERAITTLRDSVADLEQDRAAAQLAVREIRTTGALLDRFRTAFPALGDSAAGLTIIPLEPGDTLGLEYLMVPAFFAETFIIDRANAASWRAQRDGLLVVDSLRAAVAMLQDSITQLTRREALAFRSGYDSANGAYHALNTRYLAELRKPRVQVGSAVGLLLGAGTGFVVAELIR